MNRTPSRVTTDSSGHMVSVGSLEVGSGRVTVLCLIK